MNIEKYKNKYKYKNINEDQLNTIANLFLTNGTVLHNSFAPFLKHKLENKPSKFNTIYKYFEPSKINYEISKNVIRTNADTQYFYGMFDVREEALIIEVPDLSIFKFLSGSITGLSHYKAYFAKTFDSPNFKNFPKDKKIKILLYSSLTKNYKEETKIDGIDQYIKLESTLGFLLMRVYKDADIEKNKIIDKKLNDLKLNTLPSFLNKTISEHKDIVESKYYKLIFDNENNFIPVAMEAVTMQMKKFLLAFKELIDFNPKKSLYNKKIKPILPLLTDELLDSPEFKSILIKLINDKKQFFVKTGNAYTNYFVERGFIFKNFEHSEESSDEILETEIHAVVAGIGPFTNGAEEAQYFYYDTDTNGNKIDTSHDYIVEFPKSIWDNKILYTVFSSIILYDKEGFFLDNNTNIFNHNTYDKKIETSGDKIRFYIGKNKPKDFSDHNYINYKNPTKEGLLFDVLFRFYVSDFSDLDKYWKEFKFFEDNLKITKVN